MKAQVGIHGVRLILVSPSELTNKLHFSLVLIYVPVSHFYPFSSSSFNSTRFFQIQHRHTSTIWHDVIIWQTLVK